jgi:hypothetical protein
MIFETMLIIWLFEEDAVTNYEKYYREHVLPKAKLNIVDVWNNGHALEKANNPHGFLTVKSGVEAGAYFLGWNIVRLCNWPKTFIRGCLDLIMIVLHQMPLLFHQLY